jgi:hypothetical protein
MTQKPNSELTTIFISFTIIIGAIAGIGFFYLTSSISTILNTISHTESNVIGNLSDHRVIANITRDDEINLLKQILNQTR